MFSRVNTETKGKTSLAFNEKPDLIFILNPNENQNIVLEANKLHIPIIAFTESNTNIKGISISNSNEYLFNEFCLLLFKKNHQNVYCCLKNKF